MCVWFPEVKSVILQSDDKLSHSEISKAAIKILSMAMFNNI